MLQHCSALPCYTAQEVLNNTLVAYMPSAQLQIDLQPMPPTGSRWTCKCQMWRSFTSTRVKNPSTCTLQSFNCYHQVTNGSPMAKEHRNGVLRYRLFIST